MSLASECRLVIAQIIGERNQTMANMIIAETAKRLASVPLYVTDGLKFYIQALLEQYGKWIRFESSGLRGRPRSPRLIPENSLRYAQIIKIRKGGKLRQVLRKLIFGKNMNIDINSSQISTSLIERLNLTLRQDNNRLSRKTIGFSKNIEGLKNQLTFYIANYNFCRGHGSLKRLSADGKVKKCAPAMTCGLIDHNWTLRELVTYPCYITSTK
jgi:IS1 family transposase